ncbi:MAG: heme ABC exporter ATP-binding protein CcmA [Deltaproteobacteria bacterium]|nr:heme ABC exporter ATP-binding protein CcmA [Deltaproteobacteria bacterium]
MDAPAAIAARDVGRRFAGRWAVRGITLEIPAAQMVMLHGPNGSGKTTLLRVLSSAISPSQGEVRVHGVPAIEARRRIALLSHADGHYDELSGRDNLVLAKELGKMPGSVDGVLDAVALASRADDPVRAYSAGMRKRLAFARLLLKEADVVCLDEPYAALDPAGHALVDDILRQLRARGATVLVCTHQVRHVAGLVDHAIRLENGHVVEQVPAAQVSPAALAAPPPGGDA